MKRFVFLPMKAAARKAIASKLKIQETDASSASSLQVDYQVSYNKVNARGRHGLLLEIARSFQETIQPVISMKWSSWVK